ncbi:hypothetical protein B9Z65_4196 [Elsinoe australis]|uniref:Uncharacterized protein n=1 Tax=Elsinoe australis TaxID=40998 RepID=A0A2P7Z236_9PEZI|nr:hypothetical protein B9Z65_4196 [Elsinoe australis]
MPPKRKASRASNADSAIGESPSAKKNKSSSENESSVDRKFLTHGRPDWDWDRQYDERDDIPTDEYQAQNQY